MSHGKSHPAHALSIGRGPLLLDVNGQGRHVLVAPMRRLLDVLREDLGLTGTKEGCGEGECGACSVLMDGQPVNSCLVPVCQAEGQAIVTIEGLADHAVLHPVQEAFLVHGGAQCGICTPGMVVTAAWMVDQGLAGSEVTRVLAGNLCRCTGYGQIVQAVQAVISSCASKNKPLSGKIDSTPEVA